MSIVFDHGLPNPLRNTLYEGLDGLLRPTLVGLTSDTPTASGPVLRDVIRIPGDLKELVTTKMGEKYFINLLSQKADPLACIYIGRITPTGDSKNYVQRHVEIEIVVYVIVGGDGYSMDRYEIIDPVKAPGLDAIEDLVFERLYAQTPYNGFSKLDYEGGDDFWSQERSLRSMIFKTTFNRGVCIPRGVTQIDIAQASYNHAQGGIIASHQRKVKI